MKAIPGFNAKMEKAQEPTASQIEVVERIAKQYGIKVPEHFTRRAYKQFISNHYRKEA